MQIGDEGDEVHVAAAFADAVDGPLGMAGSGADGGEGVGDGHARVVVGVDADAGAGFFLDLGGGFGDEFGHGSAVGVAQHQDRRAGIFGGDQRLQGVGRVGPVGVEKMFRIVDDFPSRLAEQGHRFADHFEILFGRDVQDGADLEIAGLADQGDHGCFGGEEGAHSFVFVGLDAAAAGHAKGRQPGMAKTDFAGLAEKARILGIGQGITALDVIDAQVVELLGDRPACPGATG